MDAHQRFRDAIEAADLDATTAALSEGIVFHSPVTFRPFVGRDAVRALFSVLLGVFEDFRYVDEFVNETKAVLVFHARVGDRDIEGIDMLRFDADGLIDDFTVMVRPASAVQALGEAVGKGLAALQAGADAPA